MSKTTTATDRTHEILNAPGPYVSAYFDISDEPSSLSRQFTDEKAKLASSGVDLVPFAVQFDAIEGRTALPIGVEAGGWCAIAAADGTTITMTAPEPPRANLIAVDSFPHVGPMLEWEQAQVAHIVVSLGHENVETVLFVAGVQPEIRQIGGTASDSLAAIGDIAAETESELIVIATPPSQREVAERLQGALEEQLPSSIDVSIVVQQTEDSTEDLADAVVRLVSDQTATTTVDALRTHRQLLPMKMSVEGLADTRDALVEGRVDLLLLHDDPDDVRRIESDDLVAQSSITERTAPTGRLNDVLIASALTSGARVHITPKTQRSLRSGIGAILSEGGVREPADRTETDNQSAPSWPTSAASLSREVVGQMVLAERA